ncbi:hypothetical protein ACHAXR_002018 [Thalassiosira sp. AJA248-18]
MPPNNNESDNTGITPCSQPQGVDRFHSNNDITLHNPVVERLVDEDDSKKDERPSSSSSIISDAQQQQQKRELPPWVKAQLHHWGERVCVPEWDDDDDDEQGGEKDGKCGDYRRKNGWKGSDLCHSKQSPVRISHYCIQYKKQEGGGGGGGVGTTLTGLVHFTNNAESHAGFCHGGSMTAVMDDIIGWTAFHVSGQCVPWSGFTAQVNVSLKRPIAVGSYLKVVGTIVKLERRKVWIHSRLVSLDVGEEEEKKENNVEEEEEEEEIVHCTADGLVILKRDI